MFEVGRLEGGYFASLFDPVACGRLLVSNENLIADLEVLTEEFSGLFLAGVDRNRNVGHDLCTCSVSLEYRRDACRRRAQRAARNRTPSGDERPGHIGQ